MKIWIDSTKVREVYESIQNNLNQFNHHKEGYWHTKMKFSIQDTAQDNMGSHDTRRQSLLAALTNFSARTNQHNEQQ